MLCFNYIANIIKFGICWDDGHIGIGGEDGGYAEICGTDHLPEIGPAGLPFFGPAPPIHEERETGTANDLRAEKRITIFILTYWLLII